MDSSDLEQRYVELDRLLPTVDDLLTVPVCENGDPMVRIPEEDEFVLSFHNSQDMVDLIGSVMKVRSEVLKRLLIASKALREERGNFRLKIFYAFRALEVQVRYHDKALASARRQFPDASDEEIRRFAHILSACPDVAGHPTGGAVDVTLFDASSGEDVDLGVPVIREAIHRAGKRIYTFSPEVTEAQMDSRLLLRSVMEGVGFSPFDGEFWHFSYGDREWAFKKGVPAFYRQLSLDEVQEVR